MHVRTIFETSFHDVLRHVNSNLGARFTSYLRTSLQYVWRNVYTIHHDMSVPYFFSCVSSSRIWKFTDSRTDGHTLSNVWLCMAMYDYVRLYTTTYDYVRLDMTMYDYVWLCMTMYQYVRLCMTIYDYVWLCTTIYEYVWLCMTIYD